ncbi:hypothetical protein [Citrobacter braakii]|uniref:hypothetical protein n=1 Tax=Citrobacter braakii TaxID=57706 RepID=UPI002B244806|nr:hypothetical protein [Citrobacter braakii]MEB2440972.1 hypothetical protein [Citrobacter braakii]HCZ4695508.1 hypothetical protein [Salmonella enterica subsp. enterica serovar Saintpaul str. CFSAN004147]HCZ5289059.1 hypothetical protein [Salmonella enterica subsp. enterica serovar Saintpaul str. CFSAN004154]
MIRKEKRTETLRLAVESLRAAEVALGGLVSSYTEEQDGTFSACHPRHGLANSLSQISRLRKALEKSRA